MGILAPVHGNICPTGFATLSPITSSPIKCSGRLNKVVAMTFFDLVLAQNGEGTHFKSGASGVGKGGREGEAVTSRSSSLYSFGCKVQSRIILSPRPCLLPGYGIAAKVYRWLLLGLFRKSSSFKTSRIFLGEILQTQNKYWTESLKITFIFLFSFSPCF